MLTPSFSGLYIFFQVCIYFPIWGKMKIKRWIRWRKISEVLKTFEVADVLLLLSGSMVDPSTSDGGFRGAILPDFSRDRLFSDLLNDNNGGVTRLSAHIVTRSFPADRRGSCSIVYQRRRRVAFPAEAPIGENMVVVAEDDWEDVNPWIDDPRPLAEFGEVLHTPFGVLNMFPGVRRMRMVLNSCVNAGLGFTRGLCLVDRS
ncbi:hypothetical protein Hanom_Chr08g00707001 [Helianthus anomalus]